MYQNVLAAVDLTTETANRVIEHARAFVDDGGQLSVLHVVEPQYVQYSFDPTFRASFSRSLEESALSAALERLTELCEPFGIDADHRFVTLGRTADQTHDLARSGGFDLIVTGSHGRHGVHRLLGSTANAILHGAPVDVATVRITTSGQ